MDVSPAQISEIKQQGDGALVLSYPGKLSMEQQACLREQLKREFPNRDCIVLSDGATLIDMGAASRLEAKVDQCLAAVNTLVQALAEEQPEEPPLQALDGGRQYHERDASQSLG